MSHVSSTSALSAARRGGLVQWAAAGLAGAAIIIAFGNINVDHAKGENGGLGSALITAAGCVLLAAVLFAVVLPRYNGTRTQIVLAVLSVLSLAAFWTGAPAVFGAAAAAAGRRPSGSFGIAAWVGIAAGLIAVVWSVIQQFV
jgi:drug/metabolite transporter (DMT)-like permease